MRKRQHKCSHLQGFNIVALSDGKNYGICPDCLWLCKGHIAEANNRLRHR